jgi:hypothetical protein
VTAAIAAGIRGTINAIALLVLAVLLCSAAVCGTIDEIDEHEQLGIGAQ